MYGGYCCSTALSLGDRILKTIATLVSQRQFLLVVRGAQLWLQSVHALDRHLVDSACMWDVPLAREVAMSTCQGGEVRDDVARCIPSPRLVPSPQKDRKSVLQWGISISLLPPL